MATEEQARFYDGFIPHFESQVNNARNVGWRQWTRKWVADKSKVLDLGCSYGYNSEFLARESGCKVTGIDISPKCIETAKTKFPHCTWHCGDITDGYDVKERDFDFILMSDVIEHVPTDRHRVLFKTLGSWMKRGAVLMASVPNAELHEQIVKDTFQPVEEAVWMHDLLRMMFGGGIRRVNSLYLDGGVYYRLVAQKA